MRIALFYYQRTLVNCLCFRANVYVVSNAQNFYSTVKYRVLEPSFFSNLPITRAKRRFSLSQNIVILPRLLEL